MPLKRCAPNRPAQGEALLELDSGMLIGAHVEERQRRSVEDWEWEESDGKLKTTSEG